MAAPRYEAWDDTDSESDVELGDNVVSLLTALEMEGEATGASGDSFGKLAGEALVNGWSWMLLK